MKSLQQRALHTLASGVFFHLYSHLNGCSLTSPASIARCLPSQVSVAVYMTMSSLSFTLLLLKDLLVLLRCLPPHSVIDIDAFAAQPLLPINTSSDT